MSQAAPHAAFAAPRLLADIGGTNARFALETAPLHFEAVAVYACADHATLRDAAETYLASAAVKNVHAGPIRHGAIAIANPVEGDVIAMTNHHWRFSIAQLRADLGFELLPVVNDFTALAMALSHLAPSQRKRIGGVRPSDARASGSQESGTWLPGAEPLKSQPAGAPSPETQVSDPIVHRTLGLIGPGTGLGVSGLIPAGDRWIPLASEGGHVSFPPADETEQGMLQSLWREYGHVSAERLLSGSGLELIHRTLCGETLPAADITRRALDGSSESCLKTVECFCAVLGTVAGNVALTLGATGGVYIGGGIVPRFGELLERSAFRARFEAKGRLSGYMARIPTWLITEEFPAFLGISALLSERMLEPQTSERMPATQTSGRMAASPESGRTTASTKSQRSEHGTGHTNSIA